MRKRKDSPWKSTPDALTILGFSKSHLYRLREDGTLRRGLHWRDVRRKNSWLASYQWHTANIEKLFMGSPVNPGQGEADG